MTQKSRNVNGVELRLHAHFVAAHFVAAGSGGLGVVSFAGTRLMLSQLMIGR